MDKYEQIGTLVEASLLIAQVMHFCDDKFADKLHELRNSLADISDQIEEAK
jgi:hypothetical protein